MSENAWFSMVCALLAATFVVLFANAYSNTGVPAATCYQRGILADGTRVYVCPGEVK